MDETKVARRGIFYVSCAYEGRYWSGLVWAWDAAQATEWARLVFLTALQRLHGISLAVHPAAVQTETVETIQPPVGQPPPDPDDAGHGWLPGNEHQPPIHLRWKP